MELLIIILLFVVGIALMLAELLLPGVVMGLIGVLCVIVSVSMAFASDVGLGTVLLVIAIVFVPGFVVFWIKILDRYFALKGSQKGSSAREETMVALLHEEGVTVTALRPSGVARVGGKRVDVVAMGEMIDKGVRIKVVEVKGNRVVVRRSTL